MSQAKAIVWTDAPRLLFVWPVNPIVPWQPETGQGSPLVGGAFAGFSMRPMLGLSWPSGTAFFDSDSTSMATKAATSESRLLIQAAIAGDMFSVEWALMKLLAKQLSATSQLGRTRPRIVRRSHRSGQCALDALVIATGTPCSAGRAPGRTRYTRKGHHLRCPFRTSVAIALRATGWNMVGASGLEPLTPAV